MAKERRRFYLSEKEWGKRLNGKNTSTPSKNFEDCIRTRRTPSRRPIDMRYPSIIFGKSLDRLECGNNGTRIGSMASDYLVPTIQALWYIRFYAYFVVCIRVPVGGNLNYARQLRRRLECRRQILYLLSPLNKSRPRRNVFGSDRDASVRRITSDSEDNELPVESESLKSALESSFVCSDTSEASFPLVQAFGGRARTIGFSPFVIFPPMWYHISYPNCICICQYRILNHISRPVDLTGCKKTLSCAATDI